MEEQRKRKQELADRLIEGTQPFKEELEKIREGLKENKSELIKIHGIKSEFQDKAEYLLEDRGEGS